MITRENYEVYFIDYLDGKLSADQEDMLQRFLDENKDLAKDFLNINTFVLKPSEELCPNKQALTKSIFLRNGIENELDYLCIAHSEGDLLKNEHDRLNYLVSHSKQNQKTLLLYSKLVLKPNKNEIFHGKSSLKRHKIYANRRNLLRKGFGIAAGITLLIGLFTINQLFRIDKTAIIVLLPRVDNPIEQKIINQDFIDNTQNNEQIEKSNGHIYKSSPHNNKVNKVTVEERKTSNERIAFTKLETINIKEIETSLGEIPIPKIVFSRLAGTERKVEAIGRDIEEGRTVSNSKNIGILDLAQLGVQKFADATGLNIQLNTVKETDGFVKQINFESPLFAISKPIKKKKYSQ